VAHEKLGRRTEARALLDKFKSAQGDAGAYQFAEINTQ
jgi:hypothetical protein